MIASGQIPPEAREWYASAYLGGLEKPGGGIRPVAAGEILRRCVG